MKLQTALLFVLTLLTIVPIGLSQRRPLKVLLLYDMEGVSGATDFKHTSFSHPSEYAEGRKSLTADVNAAIAGLKAAGASEIVVVDGHGSGNNTGPDVPEDQLLPPARTLYRDAPFDIYMDSYDHSFDAIAAVGMHAAAGNSIGFLSHTYTFEDVEYKVNGVPFNESMILAAGAARLKIPLIMVSGDDQLEKEIRRAMPWVRYASIKHAVDRSKAEALPREEASRRIEAAAREGLEKLAEAKLPDWPPPYRFSLTFQDEAQARAAALVPGAELLANPASVQIRANDFEEGYRQSLRLISLAGIVARGDAARAVLNAQQNAAQLRVNTTDWLYDRFLNRLPPPPQQAAGQRQRYWGAR
jgi:D-amino peptidase